MRPVQPQRVRFYDSHPVTSSLYDAVLEGLASQPKSLPPKFFYDERGSELFDAICELPEYYLTRAETEILERNLGEISQLIGAGCILIELGSGNSRKVRRLIDVIRPQAYVPMDISREYLFSAATDVATEFPWLSVYAACVDYTNVLDLPFSPPLRRRVAFFPGSSIGNFEPADAVAFMNNTARLVGPGGGLLIGVDLKKDHAVLNAAYNDMAGVTAAFNRNLLSRINRELQATFNPDNFHHCAYYNGAAGRIEMHLVSAADQIVRVENVRFIFHEEETIHTESSYKYHVMEFQALAQRAGFQPRRVWTDAAGMFSVHFLTVPNV